MKFLLINSILLFNVLHIKAQNPNIPIKFIQELTGTPTMGCCPSLSANDYKEVLYDNFTDQNYFINKWHTAEEFNLTGPCARFTNKTSKDVYYWSPSNVTHGTTLDESGQPINALFLKVDKAEPPLTCTENGKTLTAHYTGGMIWSKEAFRYGVFEAKFKIPDGNTEALWPAFWLWGGDEIDVMEGWGWSDVHTPNGNDNSYMAWSNTIQGGPMVNANSNFLAWPVGSSSELPKLTKGVWDIL